MYKTNEIDEPLAKLTKKRGGEMTQINKIRAGKGDITTDNTEIQRITKNYCK